MIWNNIRITIEYYWRRNKLMKDRKAFDAFVYTDVDEAVKELHRRQNDLGLKKKVEKFFSKVGIPKQFQDPKGKLVLFRQLATPNIETSRFLIAADSIGIEPLFLEYLADKFTANNYAKKYLIILAFYEGTGKKGGHKVDYFPIMDINVANGKKINSININNNISFKDFHHKLFELSGFNHVKDENFFDSSDWLHTCGNSPSKYYLYVLALFITQGILFENFVLSNGYERKFTFDIFLPIFIKIKNYFGFKPLIVAISPTEIEHEEFWSCYNHQIKGKVKNYLI